MHPDFEIENDVLREYRSTFLNTRMTEVRLPDAEDARRNRAHSSEEYQRFVQQMEAMNRNEIKVLNFGSGVSNVLSDWINSAD